MGAETRDLANGWDAAVDQALAQAGTPAPEVAEGAREASEPGAPALRTIRSDPEASAPVKPTVAQVPAADAGLIDRAKKYNEFLTDVERNPALRQHILAFWNGNGAPPQQTAEPQREDDPLEGYHEQDRTALSKLLEQRDKMWEQRLEAAVAPFKEQLAQTEAQREIASLAEEAPDWKEWASREELAAVRAQFPTLSLTAAFRIVSQPKIRASINKADRQLATVRNVINRAQPAESQPRRHVKVEKPAMTYDEAFDQALARAKASSVGTPGR